jgi:hypothetical protein
MENPHTLLPFSPKTKGGWDVVFIAKGIDSGHISGIAHTDEQAPVNCEYNLLGFDYDADFLAHKETSPYNLVPTDQPPYAPQPYTQWEAERKLERYEKALHFYARGCDAAYEMDCGQTAREALKGIEDAK